jgi:ADP-ribosyl-[dinitrogen reductase] hydrolase
MAIGDSVGTTVETMPRESFKNSPITDMVGKGKFNLLPGQFTDDASMGLCLAESLLTKKSFVHLDQLERYQYWYEIGHLSSNGKCFDIGMTCRKNMMINLEKKRNYGPSNKNQSGNGCIMRLAPVPLFYAFDAELALDQSAESAKTTHHSDISLDCSRFFSGLIVGALNGVKKEELLSENYSPVLDYWKKHEMVEELKDIAEGLYKKKQSSEIINGGYVIPALEAALWAFYHSENFKEGLLKVVNLGDDADTAGAIYGQLAGAYYGIEDIPKEWIEKTSLSPLFEVYAIELHSMSNQMKEKKETTNSNDFIECQKLLNFLEVGYGKIMKKSDPGPSRYVSLDAFQLDCDDFKNEFEAFSKDFKNQKLVYSMWGEFKKRLDQQDAVQLKHHFELKSSGPPPAPIVSFGGQSSSTLKQINSNQMGDLLDSIKKIKK